MTPGYDSMLAKHEELHSPQLVYDWQTDRNCLYVSKYSEV